MIKLKDLLNERNHTGYVFADVVDDIVKDEKMKVDIIEQPRSNTIQLVIMDGGSKEALRIKKVLMDTYSIPKDKIKLGPNTSYVSVPASYMMN